MKEWTKSLKLAILEEDITKLEALMDSMPSTTDVSLAYEAKDLLEEAIKICQEKQAQLGAEISKLKNIRKCLNKYSQ